MDSQELKTLNAEDIYQAERVARLALLRAAERAAKLFAEGGDACMLDAASNAYRAAMAT